MTITIVDGIEKFRDHPSGIDTAAELRACPFCGHEAGYYSSTRDGDKFPLGVTCSNTSCGVSTPKHYRTRQLAMIAWNRREPPK